MRGTELLMGKSFVGIGKVVERLDIGSEQHVGSGETSS